MAKLKSGTRIYGTATIDTSVVVGSAVTASSSGIQVAGIATATSFSGSGTNLTGIVTSIVAGTNITVSGSTGQVTINSSSGVSISTNTTNQSQYLTYATGTGNTTGLGVSTTGLIFNPSSGNVGIATTNPLQKLHVLGNLLVSAGSSTGQHITQKAYELNSGTLSWEGSAGQLFSITNNLTSGSIFSVNDVSGIPSIDVNANGTVSMVSYGGNLGIGTTNPTSKLHVVGNVNISGISTLGVTSATNLTAQQLNVSGLSTFAGITTHTASLFGTQASFTGIVTATQLDLTASATASDSVLYLSGAPTGSSGTNGLFGIGALSFSDTDIIADFTHSVNSYAQLVVQNKNSGSSSSADIIVNNDRTAGTTYYGDFGINGTTFSGGGPFGDVDGTYLYSAGGTLSLGSLNSYDVKIATNNTERVRVSAGGSVGIGTTNPTQTLHVQGNARVTGAVYDSTNSPGTSGQVLQSTVSGTQWTTAAAGGGGDGTFDTGITTTTFVSIDSGIGTAVAGLTTVQANNDVFYGPGIGLSFANIVGNRYVIKSIHLTNTFDNELYLTARHDFNNGTLKVPVANRVVIPYNGALELLEQPTVANPGDILRLQALTGIGTTAGGVDGGLEAWITYTTKTDTNFVGVGTTVTTAGTNVGGISTYQTVYTSTGYPSVIQSIRIANYNLFIDVDASVAIFSSLGIRKGHLVYNLTVPKNSIIEICQQPKRLQASETIGVSVGSTTSGGANALSVFVSSKYITS
jgi:hypothetical protein